MNREAETLLTRLDDALALFDEPVWRELRTALAKPPEPPSVTQPGEWYRADPQRLARERAVLIRLLAPSPECPNIFFQQPGSSQIGAVGLVEARAGKRVKTEIRFPADYPASPPRVFFFGPAIGKMAQMLRDDGSVPVPFGAGQQWSPSFDGGTVLSWALEWLDSSVTVVRDAPSASRDQRRSSS